MKETLIQDLGLYGQNHLYMKREDLLPFSFGGNKARKAELFFREIDAGGYDCVVTYGSGSSNHCRVAANLCCRREIGCHIISPLETSEKTFNSLLLQCFGAEVTIVPVADVHDTIEKKLEELRNAGRNPYFIPGGGHGNIGTEAYVRCYREITAFEQREGLHFDYIFFASGTGTTQAGLVCGLLSDKEERKIIGISIARKNPRGREIVLESVRSYMGAGASEEAIQEATIFLDSYTDGYGAEDPSVRRTIEYVIRQYGIPMDPTYTGKAFTGMSAFLREQGIRGQNILFLHTGGTPLFFDTLSSFYSKRE